MRASDIFKIVGVIILLSLIGGFIFRILFKIGLLAILLLGIIYLFNRVFGRKY